MCRHMNLDAYADIIHDSVIGVIAEGKARTGDLGGKAKCSEFTDAVIEKI